MSIRESPIVSVITSHNSRIQCFVATIFKELQQICDKYNTTLPAIDTYNKQLVKPNNPKKQRQIRFKNCSILELILTKDIISFSLVYEGSLNEDTDNAYYDMRKETETDVIFPHFNIPSSNKNVFTDFKNFLQMIISNTINDKEYMFYLVRHGEGIHNRYKKQKPTLSMPGNTFASNVCKLKNLKNRTPCDVKNFDLTDPRLTNVKLDISYLEVVRNPMESNNTGEEQSIIAGKRLKLFLNDKNIIKISYFFSSQLARTRETLININSQLVDINVPTTIIILPCSSEHNTSGKEGNCDIMISNLKNSISATENKAYCPTTNNTSCNSISLSNGHPTFTINWEYFKDPNVNCKTNNMLQYAIQIINKNPNIDYKLNQVMQESQALNQGSNAQQDSQALNQGSNSQQESQALNQGSNAPQDSQVLNEGSNSQQESQALKGPAVEPQQLSEVNTEQNTENKIDTMYNDYNKYMITIFNDFGDKNSGLIQQRVKNSVSNLELYLNSSFLSVLQQKGGADKNSLNSPFEQIKEKIKLYIKKDFDNCVKNKNWVNCEKDCSNFISKLFELELGSTMYNLNCIFKSVLNDDDTNNYIQINQLKKNLTGRWEDDKQNIVLKIEGTNQSTHKLIMGFGPSASGKTFIARTIINLLAETNSKFPTKFLSIDGGRYRELSVIYQTIITITKQHNIGGINNLVSTFNAGNLMKGVKTLFDSNIVKKNICDFLNLHIPKDDTRGFINLYVPETLGECITKGKIITKTASCKPLIKEYRYITGDTTDWVALLIWQHKHGKYIDCDFAPKYKCVGCVNSGRSRQETEGKIYSHASYENSIKYGTDTMNTTRGYKFKIHNTGGNKYMDDNNTLQSSITILQDFTEYKNNNDKERIKSYILNNPSFLYIENDDFLSYCKDANIEKPQSIVKGGRKTRRKNHKKRVKTTKRYQ